MRSHSVFKLFLWALPFLLSTLACHAATRLIIPDTPIPPTATATITLTATIPPPTATPTFVAACPSLLADIMKTATSEQPDTERKIHIGRLKDAHELSYMVTYTLKDGKLANR